jgi:hypothetical protein
MDSFLLPTGYNHMFMVQKIARGFSYLGFKVKVIDRIDDMTAPGFVMISNHPVYFSLGSRHNQNGNFARIIPGIIHRLNKRFPVIGKLSVILQCWTYRKLALQAKNNNVTIIAWGLYDKRRDSLNKLNAPVIFTGDYYDRRPDPPEQRRWYDIYSDKKIRNTIPLKFAADVDPRKVGYGCRNATYLVTYVGDKTYNPEYRAPFAGNRRCRIITTPPYITEKEKLRLYKNSKIILGITSTQSKKDGQVPERIFEALAFGGVCLTDSPPAVRITNGCALLARNVRQLKEMVDKIAENPSLRQRLREKGYSYIKKDGTWTARAKDFISLSEQLYGKRF